MKKLFIGGGIFLIAAFFLLLTYTYLDFYTDTFIPDETAESGSGWNIIRFDAIGKVPIRADEKEYVATVYSNRNAGYLIIAPIMKGNKFCGYIKISPKWIGCFANFFRGESERRLSLHQSAFNTYSISDDMKGWNSKYTIAGRKDVYDFKIFPNRESPNHISFSIKKDWFPSLQPPDLNYHGRVENTDECFVSFRNRDQDKTKDAEQHRSSLGNSSF